MRYNLGDSTDGKWGGDHEDHDGDGIPDDPNEPKDPKDPVYDDGGGGSGPILPGKGATYAGQVVDSQTGNPIPSATVILLRGMAKIAAGTTDVNGSFTLRTTESAADTIVISSVGYKAWEWPASEYQRLFELERDVKELDPVIVTTGKKNSWLLWALIGFGIYKATKK